MLSDSTDVGRTSRTLTAPPADNPYATPSVNTSSSVRPRFSCGPVGLGVAVAALSCLFLTAFGVVFILGTFLAIPAFMLTVVGLFTPTRRAAVWGCCLSIYVVLHLPTMLVALT